MLICWSPDSRLCAVVFSGLANPMLLPAAKTVASIAIITIRSSFERIPVQPSGSLLGAKSLIDLAAKQGLAIVQTYQRSYMDTLMPTANYRFLDELNRALGHDLDRALDGKAATTAVLRSPRLWCFALFGYFAPSAYEPAVITRIPFAETGSCDSRSH